jgi:hypothetical protein
MEYNLSRHYNAIIEPYRDVPEGWLKISYLNTDKQNTAGH